MIKEQKVIWYRRLFYLYLFLFLLFILFTSRLAAQNLTQTIRGKVFDKQNQHPSGLWIFKMFLIIKMWEGIMMM
jgi:hypothetical protein